MSLSTSSPGDVYTNSAVGSLKIRRLLDSHILPDLGFLHMGVSTCEGFTEVVGSGSHKLKSMTGCCGTAWRELVK